MKTTEIVTSHNVIIQYELASVITRIVAQIIDIAVIIAYTILLLNIFSTAFWRNDSSVGNLILMLFFIPVLFYSFFLEGLFGGRTLGKLALGIRVVNANGNNASLGELFLRWCMRIIDILASLGAIATIVSLSNDKSQRLGDVLANTIVIKLKPNVEYTLSDVLKIKNSEGYVPTFPQVIVFNDNDMLLVKNALEKLKNNSNENYKKLNIDLISKICQKLNIPEPTKDKMSFLKTILQDYIVLTRS